IVGDGLRRNLPLGRGYIAQQLLACTGHRRRDGGPLQRIEVVQAVLRDLHDYRVFDARLRIEPEVRRNLSAAPGTSLICSRSSSAIRAVDAASFPRTCTSMGAGSPKFSV